MTEVFRKNPEELTLVENEKTTAFDKIYKEALLRKGNMIEFEGPYSKEEFLEYLVKNYNVILHGSNNQGIIEFEPRQSNDADKKSGNQIGVYGTQDTVLPMFYAIKDEEKFTGTAISGYQEESDDTGNVTKKRYNFQVEPEMIATQPWSEGIVYILPKDAFEQSTDDMGELVNEFISKNPVRPIAKLKVSPQEFPYIDQIKAIEK